MTILNSLFTNWNEVTGGAIGMKDIPDFGALGMVFTNDRQYLYLYFGIAAIVFLLMKVLFNSALGRSFMAIRDNEIAANCMGVNSLLTKSSAYFLIFFGTIVNTSSVMGKKKHKNVMDIMFVNVLAK